MDIKLELNCVACGYVGTPILERVSVHIARNLELPQDKASGDWSGHIKASCAGCGKYLRFLSRQDARARLLLLAQESERVKQDKEA